MDISKGLSCLTRTLPMHLFHLFIRRPSSVGAGYSSSVSSIGGIGQPIGSSRAVSGSQRHKASPDNTLHVLSVSTSVTKIRWRPPAFDSFLTAGEEEDNVDRHDSMLAVATARLASAGGSGVLSLWSYNRPFMPLSVVEGHEEGAVTDFVWLDTPQVNQKSKNGSKLAQAESEARRLRMNQNPSLQDTFEGRSTGREVESTLFDNKGKEKDAVKAESSSVYIWQHVLSVGRDGRCLLQSFARGAFFYLEPELRWFGFGVPHLCIVY
jgi:hypothetical protein